MEFVCIADTGLIELRITGNCIMRILNDYEDGLIDKKNIICDKRSIKLKVRNPKNLPLLKKSYISFQYHNSTPHIDTVWDFSVFTPSYVIYPIRKIKQETLDMLKIDEPIVDEYEIQKNERLMSEGCAEYELDLHSNTKQRLAENRKITYPSVINKYGKFIKLQNNLNSYNQQGVDEANTEIDSFSIDSMTDDQEFSDCDDNDPIIDASAFDELL